MMTDTLSKDLAGIVVLIVAVVLFPGQATAQTVSETDYGTWGISVSELDIPAGSVITDATLTIGGVSSVSADFDVYLLDNPRPGYHQKSKNGFGSVFAGFGHRLSGAVQDGNFICRLGDAENNDSRSFVWNSLTEPFEFTLADGRIVSYTSSLLELLDYAGTGVSFGFGIESTTNTPIEFSSLKLKLTVSSFQSPAADQILEFNYTPQSTHPDPITALRFDGVDDTVVWPWDGSSPLNGFTTSLWVKAESPTVLPRENNTSTNDGWDTRIQHVLFPLNSEVGFAVGTNGIVVYEREYAYFPALAVYAGDVGTGWNHIAVTYQDKQPRIYLNGELVHIGLRSKRTEDFRPARYVGGHESPNVGNFKGCIADIQVWRRALSPAEAAACANGTLEATGLAGHWKLNEGEGSRAFDSSGNGRNGTIYGASWILETTK